MQDAGRFSWKISGLNVVLDLERDKEGLIQKI
jgi:hypothetical protein